MRKAKKSRAQTKAETRVALLEAGIEMFANHGFEVSLDDICAHADLTRGAFYVHFADRDAFIVAVMQHVLGRFVTELTSSTSVTSVDTAIATFLGAMRAGAPIVRGGPGLRFHHVLEACRRSPVIGNAYRMLVIAGRDRLAQLCEPGIAEVLVLATFGLLVATEIELPLDLDRIERTMTRIAHGRERPLG